MREEQLRVVLETEKRLAQQEELERIQREVEVSVVETARQRLRDEELTFQKELQLAQSERLVAEESLRMREQELLERLRVLKKKKEELRKQREEEKRIREEAERRVKEEERIKEEQQREEERRSKIDSALANALLFYDEKNYDKAIEELYKIFELDSSNQQAIELEQKVREAQKKEIERAVEEKVPKEEMPYKKKVHAKIIYVAAALVVIAVGGFFILEFLQSGLLLGNISVAVLPLEGTSEEEISVGFGIAEEIVDKLSYVTSLTVMGYTSSANISRRYVEPLQAFVRLGYPYALRGTISKSGISYLIDVKLVDSLGYTLWSQTFQKSSDQLSGLAGEVAQQIVKYFEVEIETKIATGLSRTTTSDGEAYISYLKAKELLSRPTVANLRNAVQLLERAQQKDEKFAEVLAHLSLAQLQMYERMINRTERTLQLAEEFATKATVVGGTLPSLLLVKGRVALLRGRFKEALEDFEKCLQTWKNRSDAYRGKAEIMICTGNYRNALQLLEKAYELNPKDEDVLRLLAQAHQLNGTIAKGFRYHEINLSVVDDSVMYLIGSMADIISYDTDLLDMNKERIENAFEEYLRKSPRDFAAMYRRARHKQLVSSPGAVDALKQVEDLLRRELNLRPDNVEAMLYLALTLTRMGRFKEASSLVEKVKKRGMVTSGALYKMAQVYSLQKKSEVYDYFRDAVEQDFCLGEIVNGDFFNVHNDAQYRQTIVLQMK